MRKDGGREGKVKRKMPRVNQEEGSLRMSRGERENIPRADFVFSCVYYIYIYIYNIRSRQECCHGKKLESSLKMTAPFAVAHAAEVLAMVGRDSMVIYVLRYDGSYTRGTKR